MKPYGVENKSKLTRRLKSWRKMKRFGLWDDFGITWFNKKTSRQKNKKLARDDG